MIVQFGNAAPHEQVEGEIKGIDGKAVTTFEISPGNDGEGNLTPGYIMGTDAMEVLRHIAQNPGPVKHMGGNELLQDLIGLWEQHSAKAPEWISIVDPSPYPADLAEDCERCVAEYWGCDRGVPADVEETHITQYGNRVYQPGEKPDDADAELGLAESLGLAEGAN